MKSWIYEIALRLLKDKLPYLGGFVPSIVLQSLIQVAVWSRALPLAHVEYGTNECLEALLRSHGPSTEWKVLCHSEGKRNIY